MWSPRKAPMQHLAGRHFWMVMSLPCWGSQFPLGTRSITETQRFCSTRSTRMSVWSKSWWVFSFNIVELNKHSVQSWLGLFLGLGLAPQCLSLWGRASPSQFSLLKMLMRALAPLHLPGNTVQTDPLPRNLQKAKSELVSSRPNVNHKKKSIWNFNCRMYYCVNLMREIRGGEFPGSPCMHNADLNGLSGGAGELQFWNLHTGRANWVDPGRWRSYIRII